MDDYQGTTRTPQPEKKKNTTLIIVVVVLLVLCFCCLLLGGVGYWLYWNGDALLEQLLSSGLPFNAGLLV
jgi:hypothetical protein